MLVSYLSLLGQISGELGLEDVSDLTSWDNGQISEDFWSLQTKEHINENVTTSWTLGRFLYENTELG